MSGTLAACLCGAALALAIPAAAPSEPPPEPNAAEPEAVGFSEGLLAAPKLDESGLVAALALRLPDLKVRTQWATPPARAVFVSIHPSDDGATVRLELIAHDGRGYVRRLDVAATDTRGIAIGLANLLFSIEQREVVADVKDVALPESSEQEQVQQAVERLIEPEPKAEPAAPEPKPEPTTSGEPESAPAELSDAVEPATWLGSVGVSGLALVPVGAPQVGSALGGAGASVTVDAEHRSGARFGIGLRGLARQAEGFRLSRVRVALGAGYGWRRGRLDLPLRAELSVEPWWLAFDGDRLSATDFDAPGGATVALGGAVRFEPAVELPVNAGGIAAVRAGLTMALGGSFVLDGGPQVAVVRSGDPDSFDAALFRVGGAEIEVGARVAVVFGRARPSR